MVAGMSAGDGEQVGALASWKKKIRFWWKRKHLGE